MTSSRKSDHNKVISFNQYKFDILSMSFAHTDVAIAIWLGND